MSIQSPVVLFVFNRPETTQRVFERVAAARPRTLFLFADGPRDGGDNDACEEVRAIVSRVDWPCDVTTDFAASNLGCRQRIVSGLDATFATTDRAIILEDDCLPHPRFFDFCDELLERFKDEDRVMEVGGANYLPPAEQTGEGFYFSRLIRNNGWASWRRAWRHFDADIRDWPALRRERFLSQFCGWKEEAFLTDVFDRIHAGRFTSSWDYQWQLAVWRKGGLSAVPRAHLVTNIGYGAGGTHTTSDHPYGRLPLRELRDIGPTPRIEADLELDRLEVRTGRLVSMPAALRALLRRWAPAAA